MAAYFGIGYGAGMPRITRSGVPCSVTLISDDASRSSTFGLPASGASRGATPRPSAPWHCMQYVAYSRAPALPAGRCKATVVVRASYA
ncbi:hypothetical protein D3C72_1936600 [compost metagenome]